MDADKVAQMMEMMKQLGPATVRVIQYEMKGGHDCYQSSNLMTCCSEKRCQPCHIWHLKAKHGEAAVHAYTKFASVQTLTWKGREYKQPAKPKVNKVTTRKAVSKPAPAPKQISNTQDFADSIPDDQLDAIMAMMEKLRKSK